MGISVARLQAISRTLATAIVAVPGDAEKRSSSTVTSRYRRSDSERLTVLASEQERPRSSPAPRYGFLAAS